LPDPETPVKIVILRFGMRNETFFKLFSLAPRISIYSCGIISPVYLLLNINPMSEQKPGFYPPRTFTSCDEATLLKDRGLIAHALLACTTPLHRE
jgi:hypothetical protein